MARRDQTDPFVIGTVDEAFEFFFRYQGIMRVDECPCCGQRILTMIVRREGEERTRFWQLEGTVEGRVMKAFVDAAHFLDSKMGG